MQPGTLPSSKSYRLNPRPSVFCTKVCLFVCLCLCVLNTLTVLCFNNICNECRGLCLKLCFKCCVWVFFLFPPFVLISWPCQKIQSCDEWCSTCLPRPSCLFTCAALPRVLCSSPGGHTRGTCIFVGHHENHWCTPVFPNSSHPMPPPSNILIFEYRTTGHRLRDETMRVTIVSRWREAFVASLSSFNMTKCWWTWYCRRPRAKLMKSKLRVKFIHLSYVHIWLCWSQHPFMGEYK